MYFLGFCLLIIFCNQLDSGLSVGLAEELDVSHVPGAVKRLQEEGRRVYVNEIRLLFFVLFHLLLVQVSGFWKAGASTARRRSVRSRRPAAVRRCCAWETL